MPSEYEQLVQFLEGQFTQIEERIDGVERRIDALRADMLGHFDELYRRLERLEQEHQTIIQGLRRIEAALADERTRRELLERDLATLKENMAVLRARIDEIERRLRA
ncbi:MAG: V-type ATPase subunit a family protein [Candidatus Rokubacteria bacterium]|nr:V-type ATPase subunit a family protein [Candidatus Rokubacteria bacterium]